jgi:hypothetical protein
MAIAGAASQWAAFCEKRMLATLKPGTKPTSSDGRVTWKDHFVCSRDICLIKGNIVVMPAGGRTLFLEDTGTAPKLKATGEIPEWSGKEFPATFGQSADDDGNVYVQWHRRDNAGRVDIMRLEGDTLKTGDFVPGTDTNIRMDGLLSFSPVAIRGSDVFRVKPETDRGLIRHNMSSKEMKTLSGAGAICPPVLTKSHVIFGGLDGSVQYAARWWQLRIGLTITSRPAAKAPITAPVAIADRRLYVPPQRMARFMSFVSSSHQLVSSVVSRGIHPLPTHRQARRCQIRLVHQLRQLRWAELEQPGPRAAIAHALGASPRRHGEASAGLRWWADVHAHGGGADHRCEQDTGRLLWRKWWPDVYLSFTSPLYIDGKLLVPQAGMKKSFVRCLDAATGNLLWEAPFTGIAELEPTVPAGRRWQGRHLCQRQWRLRAARQREAVHLWRRAREARRWQVK